MNKTININLAGIVFHIDEEAFHKLQSYLDSIKKYLQGTQGKEEIIADIESRIAELFSEKTTDKKQVIVMIDVDEVIATMGQPEDYQVDETIFDEEPKTYRSTKPRKLYRDSENNILGGVCSGIGHYLGLDPVWVRLFFLLLFFVGVSILVYIVLWVIIPEAKTTAQKLEMQGEPANLSNIEKKVKEGFDNVKKKVNDIDIDGVENKVKQKGKSFFQMLGSVVNSFFLFLGKFFEGLFKVVGKLIGVVILIVSFAVLLSIFVSFIGFSFVDINLGNDMLPIVFTDAFIDFPFWLSSLMMFLLVGIPFFLLLLLGIRLLTSNASTLHKNIRFSLLGVWVIALFTLAYIGINQASSFSLKAAAPEISQNFHIESAKDTITISTASSEHYDRISSRDYDWLHLSYNENGEKVIYSEKVRINFLNSESDSLKVEVVKSAKGKNYKKAVDRANKIQYEYQWIGNKNNLELSSYFTAPIASKIREQEIDVTVYVPTYTVIRLNENTSENISHRVKNDQDMYRKDMAGHLWMVGEDNLLYCQDCN